MDFIDKSRNLSSIVSASADLCLKPWKHATVLNKVNSNVLSEFDELIDLTMRIECRSLEGKRYPENDLELEIYQSGGDLNLMMSWCNQPDKPLLWQGKHSVWMDSQNGRRCKTPNDGFALESLARRLLSLLASNS